MHFSLIFQTNGEYAIEIPASAYMNVARYRYDPFCVKSTIDIVAEVTESGRNTTQSAKTTIPLVSNPITVSFDDSNPNVFRPGLPYTVKVHIQYMHCTIVQFEHIQVRLS